MQNRIRQHQHPIQVQIPVDIWPDSIDIPVRVGRGSYRYENGKPCCAWGHARTQIADSSAYHAVLENWACSYGYIAHSLGLPGHTIISANDSLKSSKERRTLYLLAWAKLEYISGMPQAVLKILDALNSGKKFKSVNAAIEWAS